MTPHEGKQEPEQTQRPSWPKILAVAEVLYVMVAALIVADVRFGMTGRGEGNLGAWVLFAAVLPVALPLRLFGIFGIGTVLLFAPLGRIALFGFYGAVFAVPALIVRARLHRTLSKPNGEPHARW